MYDRERVCNRLFAFWPSNCIVLGEQDRDLVVNAPESDPALQDFEVWTLNNPNPRPISRCDPFPREQEYKNPKFQEQEIWIAYVI